MENPGGRESGYGILKNGMEKKLFRQAGIDETTSDIVLKCEPLLGRILQQPSIRIPSEANRFSFIIRNSNLTSWNPLGLS